MKRSRRREPLVWSLAIAFSVVVHAGAIVALTRFATATLPELRIPSGRAVGVRVRLIEPEQQTEPASPETTTPKVPPPKEPPPVERIVVQSAPWRPNIVEPIRAEVRSLLGTIDKAFDPIERALHAQAASTATPPAPAQAEEPVRPPADAPGAPVEIETPTPQQGAQAGVLEPPTPSVSNRPPAYPDRARRKKQSGTVLLRITIDTSGSVSQATVQGSSGFTLLDEAAVLAATGWRFEPARRDGVAVESDLNIPVRFVLR